VKLRTALDEAPPAVDVAEKATKIRVNLLRDVAKWLAGGEDKGATTLLRSALGPGDADEDAVEHSECALRVVRKPSIALVFCVGVSCWSAVELTCVHFCRVGTRASVMYVGA